MTVSNDINAQPGLLFEAPLTTVLKSADDYAPRAASNVLPRIDLTVHTDLAEVEAAWRALETVGACTAFQTFLWHDAWQRHIGARRGVAPAIVVGRLADEVLFIAPLAVVRGWGARQLIWHASDLCDYNAPLLAPNFWSVVSADNFRATLFPAIKSAVAAVRPFDLISLSKMPERVGELANPFASLSAQANPSSAYLMHLGEEWESFYFAKRSSATRRRDRKKIKSLEAMGAVRFETAEGAASVNGDLDVLFVQKTRSLHAMGARDFLAEPGVTDFFREVATRDNTAVHVSHLMVGDVVAAVNLGVVFRQRYYHVLASYSDGPVSKWGPGAAHLRDLFIYAIGRGCRIFDFTIGDERYKSEWSDETLRLHDYHAAVNFIGWLVASPQVAMSSARRVVKQTPFLWALAQRVRRLLPGRRVADAAPSSEEQSD